MNWRVWKRGLLIAVLDGLFKAMIGWAVDLTLKQIGTLFLVNIGTMGLAYLAKHPADSIKDDDTMKTIITILIITNLLAVGCARFQTSQTDKTTFPDGHIEERTTHASAVTVFDAKSDLAKFRASQSDKTQSATVGALGQESSGTNAVQLLHELNVLLNGRGERPGPKDA